MPLPMIDGLHERPEDTAGRNFRENFEHFNVGEDYFEVPYAEWVKILVRRNSSDQKGGHRGPMIFLTESGYLLLVKSFTHELAWKIQWQLINCYFRVKESCQVKPSPKLPPRDPDRLQDELWNLSLRIARLEEQMRGALPPAPCDTQRATRACLPGPHTGPEASRLGALLSVWFETFGSAGGTVASAIQEAERDLQGPLWTALNNVAGERGRINCRRLGWWILNHMGQVVEGAWFLRLGVRHNTVIWAVEQTRESDPSGACRVSCPTGGAS